MPRITDYSFLFQSMFGTSRMNLVNNIQLSQINSNFVILSRLLHTSIEDILVVDGDVVRFRGNSFKLLVQ